MKESIWLSTIITLLLVCTITMAQTTKKDSLFSVAKKEQDKLQKINNCPSCPLTVVSQYFSFIKAGDITKANTLVNHVGCKEECGMPMFHITYEELSANPSEAKEIGKYEFNKDLVVLYIDKDNCLIYNWINTSATVHPLCATKINGSWKLNVLNREIEKSYFAKLLKVLGLHPQEYMSKLPKK